MFTKGQLVFGILFAIVFVVVLIYAYRKDIQLHKKYYKGSIWVLIAFISFILLLVTIKWLFQ
ncbi:hypothetical protein C1T31_07585 [Hanstruepera neustonica]|uniref:Uncharacterized protein n=1 Tax=Hanstruepera neustonica TaxID=1445657 RepID=A0A2K1DZB4_9FLAO|nr:hypothetical protein [Hanstruepera neustonica]PNQ73369.1 hypothetical protein C1T31_07585 [Hanstruepera neustonica]